jgi:hypothetical protein
MGNRPPRWQEFGQGIALPLSRTVRYSFSSGICCNARNISCWITGMTSAMYKPNLLIADLPTGDPKKSAAHAWIAGTNNASSNNDRSVFTFFSRFGAAERAIRR